MYYRYQCVYTNLRLDVRDDTLCISAQVQGGNISSECTSKVGISTLKYRESFPSGVLRLWREVLLVLFELFRQDSFMSETLQTKCIQAVLASSMWGRDILVSNATRICYLYIYECSFNLIMAGNPARICLLQDVPLLFYWIGELLSCYRLHYI